MSSKLAKDTVEQFVVRIEAAAGYHRELLVATHLKRHQSALETMLAEQFVFYITVLWEVFLNDILVAYLVTSPHRYLKGLKDRIVQSTEAKFGNAACDLMRFNLPQSLTRQKAHSLADPRHFNISVESAAKLSSYANNFLTAKFARRFTLDPDSSQFIDYVIAIRNYLAHRSRSSRKALNQSVRALAGANAVLGGNASDFGTYLKFKDANDSTRSLLIAERLVQVAKLFA